MTGARADLRDAASAGAVAGGRARPEHGKTLIMIRPKICKKK
jgi:hypothetical protein